MSEVLKGRLAVALVVVCWSGFNIVSRFGSTGTFTAFDLGALRFGVSAAIALPFFLRLVPRREWPRHAALAACGGLGYALLVYSGFQFAPSAHAGVFVNGGIPLWTVILLAAGAGFPLSRRVLSALLLSSAGLLLIGAESLLAPQHPGSWAGDLLFFAAAGCWAAFGLLTRRWQIAPQRAVLGIASISAVIYLPAYLAFLPKAIGQASWQDLLLQGVYQGVVAAMLAAGMFSYATQKIGASQAAMALALVPAVSAVGASLLIDEAISPTAAVGILIVSAGALLGALQRNPAPAAAGR
ncbi:EamA family transporter [Azoarcus indigens]|uniref:EamA-like transporter family protein n=1 Tax=Azoarcus indigens TaxID=29545 RepID=A0A4V3BMP4_9RHOO|nr:DMT family transporter [Azoarcus indigens]NMG66184.1 EamA family transporter [Azoarcus indigens]TDN51352.1 EamA-like transporter family protein [Azoarcus indigens]